jgi:hypothetical protein
MGQDLLNPPTVEGWHTGKEWIDSGTLVERVNFTAGEVGRVNAPGIKDIITRLGAPGPAISAEELVDGCLDMLGGYNLMSETRSLLLGHASESEAVSDGAVDTGAPEFPELVAQLLQLIVSTQEYQFT